MHNNTLAVTLKPTVYRKTQRGKKILVEFNADQFERLAATFGFFNPEFLRSLDRAEKEYRDGKFWKLKSLRDLRSQ